MGSFAAALGLVFLAELGDKTQLVALSFGARHRLRPVLAGMVLAYMVTNLVSVVIGGVLGAALPTRAIGIGGGLLFIGFAVWTLFDDDDDDDRVGTARAGRSVVLAVSAALIVAELGDKTMLAIATLAAKGNPVATWFGAVVGMVAAGLIGVALGRGLGARLSPKVVRYGAAALFAAFGVGLLVTSW